MSRETYVFLKKLFHESAVINDRSGQTFDDGCYPATNAPSQAFHYSNLADLHVQIKLQIPE